MWLPTSTVDVLPEVKPLASGSTWTPSSVVTMGWMPNAIGPVRSPLKSVPPSKTGVPVARSTSE